MSYPEEQWLQLAGLQHYAYCPRQWALIHLEQQWAENLRTTQGHILHEKAHEASSEKRGGLLILRDLRVFSETLGISGACDVVEFYEDEAGVPLHGRPGKWRPYPVEYKRGKPKEHQADELQLCAQALCLEEMLCCTICEGALYYGEPRRREPVAFTESLRRTVAGWLREMHELARRGHTPKPGPGRRCSACSLKDLCLPGLRRHADAKAYLRAAIEEVSPCKSS